MISLQTNLSSIITQNNLTTSTNRLNQAIERMSTGYKINHASDNAANYSISTDMTTKINAYQVAEDNTAMGVDLVMTVQDTISLMQSHGARIRSLITQAQNGTYGGDSQSAIVAEIDARISEIDRLYNTTEYNGKSLFNSTSHELPDGMPQAGESGFIDESVNRVTYSDSEVAAMTSVSSVTGNYTSGTKYKISSAEELQKLATDVNKGKTHAGAIFVLANDLDLSEVENFTPIGKSTSSKQFKGIFDGNGHTIENLNINNTNTNYQGLFGYVSGGKIKNVDLKNVNVNGKSHVGGLAGYVTGSSSILNCSISDVAINATSSNCGGLIGYVNSSSSVNNVFCTNGKINSKDNYVGGLIGQIKNDSLIENSYSTCDVSGKSNIGGLIGVVKVDCNIHNCYSTGNVSGSGGGVGGFIGVLSAGSSADFCYSSGFVTGVNHVGGFVGLTGASVDASGDVSITNSASYSDVIANNMCGSFIGTHRNRVIYPADYPNYGGEVYTSNLNLTNCSSSALAGMNTIGGVYDRVYSYDGVTTDSEYVLYESYDMSGLLSAISVSSIKGENTSLQVGINGDTSSNISFNSNFRYGLNGITGGGTVSSLAFDIIDNFMNTLSKKAVELGAVSNRLDSALESIAVNIDNLTSSRSTLQDADIGKVSSDYIRQQILQQACATLMSTANQNPEIALQLL